MRQLNRAAVVVVAAVVSGCAPNDADPLQHETSAVIANRNLDVLFVIDNSSSMRLSQTNLTANFPAFMDTLQNLPGGLPNIHVAVISSDLGAGDGTVPSCSRTGDEGKFHFAPQAPCTATTLQGGATFISNVGGAANYTAADISTVFSCIAALGDTGCGFERPFSSVLRALGADEMPAPAENQGFLRADALLAIVIVTNEDDCSARPDSDLYDFSTSSMSLASPLGPPGNFRCNEFGHLCDGVRPPRQAPGDEMSATTTLDNCTSAECDGSLVPVAEFVARLRALKTAPSSEIVVGAIAGPPTPYTVQWNAPSIVDTSCNQATCPWPSIAHSCTSADGSFADPGVRITDWVHAFGANGIASSICDTNFGPALQQIAARISALLTAGGNTGGPPGPIPNCAVTGIGGRIATGAAGGAAGSSSAGGTPGGDAAAGTGISIPPPANGCGCQTSGEGAGVAAFGAGGAIIAWLVRRQRRRRRASGPGHRG
jgi:MYXO-CTERM domain-containing protein